jgi:3-deoxy-D-manno-octulosonic-acid transferase
VRIILLYRLIQLLAFPFLIVYFALRLLSNGAYRSHFRERLGFLPRRLERTAPGAIWLHAVSAGEIATAVPLVKRLHEQEPRIPILISTSTAAGRAVALKHFEGIAEGIFYCPLDYASCVRRVLSRLKPSLVIVLETEIWPNLYAEVKRIGTSLAIVNARISTRSWPQYRSVKWFFAPVLRLPDLVLPQSVVDRERYYRLGVPPSKLQLEGNLKYDSSSVEAPATIPTFDADPVWIAASTVAPGESMHYTHGIDEDHIVLDAFETLKREFPRLLLILAPRQPARFEAVAAQLRKRNLRFIRRTELLQQPDLQLALPGVLLLDTLGELAGAFALAQVVFVGGSIAPRGGHNILEPASSGAAIITGPHMENFEAIAHEFLEAGAMLQVDSPQDLAPLTATLLRDRDQARRIGGRARLLVEHKRGSADRVAAKLWPLYWSASPRSPHGLFARAVLAPLSELWIVGGRIKRRQDEARQDRLPIPVVSVGAITVGGAGKTPFTNYLAKQLYDRGQRAAILTRGYRRRTPARNIILPPGAKVSAALTGDEAQIFLRAGISPIGIGANRAETGRLLMQHYEIELFLLDDGFQHRKLYRDVDIVVIDGLTPFGQRHVIPLGRLREPLPSLSHADAIVITRADNNLRFELLAKQFRQFNPHAPVFRVFTRALQWRMSRQQTTLPELPFRHVAAFCALGNPQGFWNLLSQMGLEVVYRWTFPDHHEYKPAELRRFASQAKGAGAQILVTTEKDRINFPGDFASAVGPFEVAWLEIEHVLEREQEFFKWLESTLAARSAERASGLPYYHSWRHLRRDADSEPEV